MNTDLERVYNMTFATIYPMYVDKVEKKGKTVEELDDLLHWLTGYDKDGIIKQVESEATLREFFENAPALNTNRKMIRGVICGVRVEEMEENLMQEIRYMDKIVDELAKGKKIESIKRS